LLHNPSAFHGMAKLINPPTNRSGTATPGERRFARRLETLLEDDYLCWYDVPIGPKRQHPDFIILHPARGLLLLEVKDWKIDTIRHIDKFSVDLLLESGTITRVANPLEQARAYINAVINCLSPDPQLRGPSGPHLGKICFPYGYGVVLTNITRKQLPAPALR
jgi:hypothetical protein